MDKAGWYLLRRVFMKAGASSKSAGGLLILLAVLLAFCLAAGSAHAQGATATSGPYPTPIGPYPSPETGQETATLPPAASPTLAASATPGIPIPTSQSTAALPSPTLEPAQALPEAQSTQDLQANPQSSGPEPTYVPLPAITFELPDQSTAPVQAQTSPTPTAAQEGGGAARWVPLAVIVVIWSLLAGWFYLSFRRLG
jgi:flagellar basal body-associated protein FliL